MVARVGLWPDGHRTRIGIFAFCEWPIETKVLELELRNANN